MNSKNNVLNFLYKRQRWLEALAIFLIFFGVSFSFESGETTWIWANYPYIAVLIAGLSVVLALLWLKIEKHKVQNTIDEIHKNNERIDKRDLLTHRQQQVFDLILQNKTNKEISEELFIELSTLKTHINNIYKTLDIKSRKETKKFK